jgi:hypothetical protein
VLALVASLQAEEIESVHAKQDIELIFFLKFITSTFFLCELIEFLLPKDKNRGCKGSTIGKSSIEFLPNPDQTRNICGLKRAVKATPFK